MLRPRIIPCLLLKGGVLVKGVGFSEHQYVGNPMNVIRIFSNKGVDELIIFDIDASISGKSPDVELIKKISDECFIPFAVGGGIKDLDTASNIIGNGAEKIIICTAAVENPKIISEMSKKFGSQSVVVCVDVKKYDGKYYAYTNCGRNKTEICPTDIAKRSVDLGSGEIIINSIDRDGTFSGYDLELVSKFIEVVQVPLVVCGGAGKFDDFKTVIKDVEAVAAGAMFVFYSPKRSVLINFPNNNMKKELNSYKWET